MFYKLSRHTYEINNEQNSLSSNDKYIGASGFVWWQVPDNYKLNVEIQAKYDKIINELFVDIKAKS